MDDKKALIFDMDGTMVNSMPWHISSWLAFLKNHDIHLNEAEFEVHNHGNITEVLRRFFSEDKFSDDALIDLGNEKETLFRSMYKNDLKEIKGLTKLLQDAKNRHKKLGLATMGDLNNINFTLDGLGIKAYFDVILGGHDVSKGKPDPEIYLKMLEKLNVKPDDAVVFEDSKSGIQSSLAAGIQVIGLSTSHTKEELLSFGAAEVIKDFEEVRLD